MVKFTVQQMREVMDNRTRLRNLAIVAHVDHGKSTLTDSLVFKAGLLSREKAGTARVTDTRKDEQLRGVTIKSTGISLGYEVPPVVTGLPDAEPFVFNLIDSPGHVDFSSEVTAALRVTDGCFVVVDCVEGVCVQTETVLRQALAERVRPVLVLNKLDRVILELQRDPEEAYQSFSRTIESVNAILSQYTDPALPDLVMSPTKGNVVFASGLQGWAFSLSDFARRYHEKNGIAVERLVERLWGDWFWDETANSFRKAPVDDAGKPRMRAFCKFVLEPIYRVFAAGMADDKEAVDTLAKNVGVEMRAAELEALAGKKLCQAVMQQWLPAADALIELAVRHLPSPLDAQPYRTEILYQGPLDDECAVAMRECNPEGPLVLYVSKMTPLGDSGRFVAFGRVFAGTVRTGAHVRVLGPEYVPGSKSDSFSGTVQRTVVWMGSRLEPVPDVPCGCTVGLVGVDQYLLKTGTITTSAVAHSLKTMKLSVSPVVRVSVETTNAVDLPKLAEAMKRLSKTDPCVLCHIDEETGEHIVEAAGELHMEICLHDLEEFVGVPIKCSNPVVTLAETVTATSPEPCLAKSANKHNRFWMTAEPIAPELVEQLEKGTLPTDKLERARHISEKYEWAIEDARKTWAMEGTCMLVDTSSGVSYLHEAKESVVAAFVLAVRQAVLTNGRLRGVRFNLVDAELHADAVHRGPGQVIPAVKRALFASLLTASPRLLEPMFAVEVSAPADALSGIYRTLGARRGMVVAQDSKEGSPMMVVKAHMPIAESFGFSDALRSETSGKAFPNCVFDHWALVPSDPLVAGTQAADLATETRTRKRLPPAIPPLATYMDRL